MQNHLDGGEAVLEALRRLGVDCIMSSPGSEWSPIWEAVARQQRDQRDGPRFVDCWHETLAVDMAIGYALGSGRLQAVMLHSGAGLLQGSMGILGATHWEVPLIVMSGESSTYGENPDFDPGGQWLRNLSIVGGLQSLVAPITKWASHVSTTEILHQTVVRAGEMAQRVPCGPTYISVPYETMLAQWAPPEETITVPDPPKTQGVGDDLMQVAELLVQSKKPMVIVESLGTDPAGYEALVALADHLALPVYDGTASVTANFPKSHELYLGNDPESSLQDVDLVLAVRCRAPWYPTSKRPAAAKVISIDENPHRPHMVYQNLGADIYLEGDSATNLELLLRQVESVGIDQDLVANRRERVSKEHRERFGKLRSAQEATEKDQPINPLWLLNSLNETMPDDVIYVDETTLHGGMIRGQLNWNRPQSYFASRGGLGQGLGLALGLKMACPERPVVALMGDGGLLYNPVVQALGAAREYELPILIVVFNNRRYAAMRWEHERSYPEGAAVELDKFDGLHINGPDYSPLSEAYGGIGITVEDPSKLAAALAEGLDAVNDGKTAIIDVALGR